MPVCTAVPLERETECWNMKSDDKANVPSRFLGWSVGVLSRVPVLGIEGTVG